MNKPLFLTYPSPAENPICRCKTNPFNATLCEHGHMMECHYPYVCRTAGCSHLSKYDVTPEEFKAMQDEAREKIRIGQMWPYRLDACGQVYVDLAWYRSGRGSDMPGTAMELDLVQGQASA